MVNIGFVGPGNWGPNLARNLSNVMNGSLVYNRKLGEDNLSKVRILCPQAKITHRLGEAYP